MKWNGLTLCLMLSAAPLWAAPVSVGARATGGFGNFNTGWQDLTQGIVFTAAGEQAVLIADGQVNGGAGGVTITGPDGFPGPVDNNFLLTTNYAPLEEAAVDAGTLVLPRTAGTTVPGFQALFAAFVPDAMAGLPGFRPHDEDLVSAGQTGIPAGSLFFAGRGPKLFTAPGAGRLYFGVNDTYAANNTGSYLVSVPEPQSPPQALPVQIHEVLTNNSGALRDEDGDSPDWIELYNPAATAAALAGWELRSDSRTWTLPAVTIPPQRYLVVFASGKDRTVPAAPLHTNFALDAAGGESLTLHQPAGTEVSGFAALPAQTAGYSYGRNGAGEAVWFPVATPGHANGAFVRGFVADTKFSVDRGFYDAPVTVAITTDTPGAVIRYTTDGSEPAASSGAIYSAPLTISATTVLRARAFLTEWLPSNTDTHSYLFLNDVLQQTHGGALAAGFPASPVNGQTLRYGLQASLAAGYTLPQKVAALRQIPSLSLVTGRAQLFDPATGIYVNGTQDGAAWERPVSLELIHPNGAPGFQEDCGLRIRGGQSRTGAFPKHSFHINFRAEYGAAKLRYPIFGSAGAQEFDTFDLRCEHGYAYADPHNLGHEFTALRDVFCRDLWAAAGEATTRSQPYHLYLNGQYWGLYQSQERPEESYGATYLGGSKEDYDVVKATGLPQLVTENTAGTFAAWQALWNGARAVAATPTAAAYFALSGKNADGTPNATLPVLVDPEHLAAYLLLHYYCGHSDEPLSVSFGFERPNNFRALRRHDRETSAWRFFVHDGESSLRAPEWVDNRANAVNLTSANRAQFQFSNPEWIHEDLLASAEYRMAFADTAQRLLLNDGPFTAAKAQTLWDARAAQIDLAVIGESMRWGQAANHTKATWDAKVAEVRALFFPSRSAAVITQLRQRALFPGVIAPSWSQRGVVVAAGTIITLNSGAQQGTIYYTPDGSDPRAIGGAVSASAAAYVPQGIVINGPVTVKVRFRSDAGEWSALDKAAFTLVPPAAQGLLVLSKIHYHPSDPTAEELSAGITDDGEFEYLEFLNTTAQPLDIRNVRITAGVTFSFAGAALTTLPPGGRVLVVKNAAAFALRYGGGLPVAGEFTGSLSNAGEVLRVTTDEGTLIAEVSYGDASPWPAADGDGRALVLRDPALPAGEAASWRVSYLPGGLPGAEDVLTFANWQPFHFTAAERADSAVSGPLADPDRDGFTTLVEFTLDGDPRDPNSVPVLRGALTGDPLRLRLTHSIREGVTGLSITAQSSSDLITWPGRPQPAGPPVPGADGTWLVTVEEPVNAGETRRFFRVAVE